MKNIKLSPRLNKANGQINFQLKKTSLPKKFRNKLSRLKSIKLDMEDFEFDEW